MINFIVKAVVWFVDLFPTNPLYEKLEDDVCPKCKNSENLHFNYDYSKKDRPIINVLCNECGEFFGDRNCKHYVKNWDSDRGTMLCSGCGKDFTDELIRK